MLDVRDSPFKLFGETIPVLSDGVRSSEEFSSDSNDDGSFNSEQVAEEMETDLQEEKGQAEQKSTDETLLEDNPPLLSAIKKDEHSMDHQTVSRAISEDQNTPNSLDENSADEPQNDVEKPQAEELKNSQEKTIKKPDKILPCPRCNSMDTKFCYYNNYNVNQPRHFCKSCQRYWTAGGTMRNVPVGAGRRKNKSSSSRYCQISISDALQAARIDLPNGFHHTRQQPEAGLKMNGTVLTFGADSPLCESMASMMNLTEKKVLNETRNGFQVQCRSGENVDDRSTGSSTVTTSTSMEEGSLNGSSSSKNQIPQNINGFTGHQVPCVPGFQLAYGWNPAVPLPPPPPGYFLPAGFPPMPFYPAPFWNGAAMPMPWNIPWPSPSSLSPKSPGSNPSSPTLGKHSRDEDTLNPSSEAERSSNSSQVLVPKTLRIDDPEDAAKSSIWTTLGIKKVEPAGNGGFFKGLQSKGEEKKHKMESFPVLNANPAAMARSVSFHETA